MQKTRRQMEAPVYYSTGESSRRPGIPPAHPNNPQAMLASRQHLNPNANMRPPSLSSQYRSVSQSSVFETLPPWTPMNNMLANNYNYHQRQHHESSPSTFVGVDQSLTGNVASTVEGRAGNSHGLLAPPPPPVVGGESLPARKGHRRSVSDSPLGFSSPQVTPSWGANVERMSENDIVGDLMSEYMSMEDLDVDFDSGGSVSVSKMNGGESSDNEVDSRILIGGVHGIGSSGVKRSADEDIALTAGHYRSVSVDSYLEFLDFEDDDLVRVPVQAQVEPVSLGSTSQFDERLAMLRMKLSGELCEADLTKIARSDKLTTVALDDPRHAKRVLANRQSAARSKERKVKYIAELEQKVKTLLGEMNTLSTKYTTLQKDSAGILKKSKELEFRLEAMGQEAKLKDALNESITAELERLKADMNEMAQLTRCLAQQLSLNNQVLQNQHQQSILPSLYQLLQQQQNLLSNQLQLQQQEPQPHQLQQQQQDPLPNQLQPQPQNGEGCNS